MLTAPLRYNGDWGGDERDAAAGLLAAAPVLASPDERPETVAAALAPGLAAAARDVGRRAALSFAFDAGKLAAAPDRAAAALADAARVFDVACRRAGSGAALPEEAAEGRRWHAAARKLAFLGAWARDPASASALALLAGELDAEYAALAEFADGEVV